MRCELIIRADDFLTPRHELQDEITEAREAAVRKADESADAAAAGRLEAERTLVEATEQQQQRHGVEMADMQARLDKSMCAIFNLKSSLYNLQ